LPKTAFHNNEGYTSRGGKDGSCKVCKQGIGAKHRAANPRSIRVAKQKRLAASYNTKRKCLVDIYKSTGHRCNACGQLGRHAGYRWKSKLPKLVIDHDHSLGKTEESIRGPLCEDCNKSLGFAHDSIPRLRGLIRHISQFDEKQKLLAGVE